MINNSKPTYGVHDWIDGHGNVGSELVSERHIRVPTVQVSGLFDPGRHNKATQTALTDYFNRGGGARRKVCVVVDNQLPEAGLAQIEAYLAWCKEENLLEAYNTTRIAVYRPTEKTLSEVYTVVKAAEHLALRRRDLFVAIGNPSVTDIVGFAAAIYRRSTPWIWVPTDPVGVERCSSCYNNLSINYTTGNDGPVYEGLFSLSHPPTASFYDPGFPINALRENGIKSGSEETNTFTNGHVAGIVSCFHEQTASEVVQYHVASVSDIFSRSNKTLIQGYCTGNSPDQPKKKILVVVDAHLGSSTLAFISRYFESHRSAIADFRLLPFYVSSKGKDMVSVLKVVDAAIKFNISQHDRLVVVGGGTLMDVVGFAAAMYKGGIPYVRIPTTLVGMIDAGVGVKVGVNFESHKNFIGRYYAPVACLNDAATFLPTLPRREFACGLAEAIKMAILKSRRLFEVIQTQHQNLEYNTYTHEVIYLSIRTMLEELQPNLYEESLIRLVDFGHEFGHIVESLAKFEIPHGECVGIGMAISSFLAHRKGVTSRADLERILDCTLSLGLPIYVTDHDCCDAGILWDKIRTDGIEHKDGMLYLAIPKTIGQGTFLENISDIDASMVSEVMLSLKRYADEYTRRGIASNTTNGFTGANGEALATARSSQSNSQPSLPNGGQPSPYSESLSGSDGEICIVNGVHPFPRSTTAAVIGASGDIGSQFAGYLVRNGVRVICTVRPASLHSFKQRMSSRTDPKMRVIATHPLDVANLKFIIQEANIIYNMAGVVTLSSKSEDAARVIALNGFGQGIITHLIKKMGRDKDIKVVYPSSQRVHLVAADASVTAWIQDAAQAYLAREEALVAEPDVFMELERFSQDLLTSHPLPPGFNVYEISKRLGEHFVSLLPRYVLVRISGVYGPSFTRGFISRAVHPKSKENVETSEIRDFIYVDDLNEILWKAAHTQPPDSDAFDGASGEATDLKDVWRMARELIGDGATVVFKDNGAPPEAIHLNTDFSRQLLGRDFVPFRVGLRKTIDGSVRSPRQRSVTSFPYPKTFEPTQGGDSVMLDTALLTFSRSGHTFHVDTKETPFTLAVERSLNRWFNKLRPSHQDMLTEYMSVAGGLTIRLRSMPQTSEFKIEKDGQIGYRAFIDIHTGVASRASYPGVAENIDDIIGHGGYHLIAFLLRGRRPLFPGRERDQEQVMGENWKDFLRPWGKPYVIVLDVGSTYLRVAVMGPHGKLLAEPTRAPSPSKQSFPRDTLPGLQEKLLETIVREVHIARATHTDLSLEEVGIAFGAVCDREGIVQDASIFWGEPARGYDLRTALLQRLPSVRLTLLNDVSAAAWRYKDKGRLCLITVSSGLANKVFNPDLSSLDKLDLDAAGLGGEMGHVVVEPRAVEELVQHAISSATAYPKAFGRSRLSIYAHGDAQRINARHLGMAVKENDDFAMNLLEERRIPCCPCGNIADLCSYSSGRGALRYAQQLAARGNYDVKSDEITDGWLQQAIATAHPLACKVLYDSTYPLALRILQLSADLGLHKFIIIGGFVMKTAKGVYLQAVQHHLMRFCSYSAFFSGWTEDRVREMVELGVDDDNDALIGMGHFVQHLRAQYRAVEKAVGEQSLAVVSRSIPRCGAREVLSRVVFSGICSTDLQILRGERGLEPTVLGHEGVCQVVEVGRDVKGLSEGEMMVLLPNNPLDDHEKIGHNREGLFQEYIKFGQEFLDRGQVLTLGRSALSATDTLVEPLSCVVAAQDRIKDRIAGKNVLVVGAGPVGLLFVLMNTKMGARNVFLANRSKERLDFAVARGIVQPDKVFVTGDDISSSVAKASEGEGVDVVVICVSLGQGIRAAQDATAYVNAGGCVYLFGGFCSGDVLALGGGAEKDIWPIRSGWKTERVVVSGKPVDLSGHRGSRNEDVAKAADILSSDGLSFSRVISHIISLDVVPEVMKGLAEDGKIRGVPAKRVVVDMNAPDGVVESAEELPLRHLREAAMKQKDDIPMGNLFREIGFQGNTSALGWFCPPAWHDVNTTIETALQLRSLSSKRHFIWIGTGGWAFSVDLLKEILPISQGMTIHTIQSLDPEALVDLFAHVEDLSAAVCLGTSQSGKTLETVTLMNTLRDRFDSAGLDYREHFVWLTDTCTSVHDCTSGEAVIRSIKTHDWTEVDVVPLTVQNHSGINALFCAPHSMLMFLPLALQLGQDLKAMYQIYQKYISSRDGLIRDILPKAYAIASGHIDHIQVELHEIIATAMERLIIQLFEQGLGSKQVGFNPRVRVTSGENIMPGSEPLVLPMPAEISAVVKAMLTMSTLSTFCAMVAYHRRINFVTHPKVDLYKRRAVQLMATSGLEQKVQVSEAGSIRLEVTAFLNDNPQVRFVDVLYYGYLPASSLQTVKDQWVSRLELETRGISVNLVQGEQWNHSEYQAAVQTEDTLYVILISDKYCREVEGISEEAIHENTRLLRAIARATYETLLPKALYF